jgi:hypothetical protein
MLTEQIKLCAAELWNLSGATQCRERFFSCRNAAVSRNGQLIYS